MNKAVVGSVIAVVLLGGGALLGSAFIGRASLQRLDGYSAELVKVMPSAQLGAEHVQHGLFHSTRTWTLKLGCMRDGDAKPTPIAVTVVDEIRHGPLLGADGLGWAAIDSRLIAAEPWQAKVQRVIGDQPLLTAHTVVRFDGRFRSAIKTAGFNMRDPGGADSVTVEPIASTLTATPAATAHTTLYVFEIPQVAMRAEAGGGDISLAMSGLESSVTVPDASAAPTAAAVSWIRPSEAKGQLASVEVRGHAPSALGSAGKAFDLVFDHATATTKTALDAGLVTSETQLSMKGRYNDLPIDKIEFKTALRRIHAATYQRFVSQFSALSCEDQAQQQHAFAKLMSDQQTLLPELLVHDPEYALGPLVIELGGQRAEFLVSGATHGITKAELDQGVMPALMHKGVASVSMVVQMGLIERLLAAGDAPQLLDLAKPMIEHFADEGYVVRDGDQIKASAALDHGQLSLNGKPFALPDLGGLAGALPIAGP